MRVALAFCLGLVALTGCQTRTPQVISDSAPRLASDMYVTLPRLARRLSLAYHGGDGGLIELFSPPDHIMLVAESRQAIVNGRSMALGHPCIRRGDDYAVRAEDAARVGQVLDDIRSERARMPAAPVPPPVATAPTLPPRWQPSAPARAWRYVVIHHQAATSGSAAVIHRAHRRRGMDGLGYHFVIGNGTGSGAGQIEVGYRWEQQGHGAHARVQPGDDNRWNNYGIGICLVGDFRYDAPSEAQMDSLVALVRSLCAAYGIPSRRVVPHDFVKPTICPGPRFPWSEFHSRIR